MSSHRKDKLLNVHTLSVFQFCTILMESTKKLSRSSSYKTFRDKSDAGHNSEPSPWADLRHAAGRLLSYLEGAKTLVEARSVVGWEPLFYDFEVVCIPSSKPDPNPIVKKNAGAAEILNRMTPSSDGLKLDAFQRDAQELQKFGLDENIRTQNYKPSFQPIVHAEILNHESLVNDPDIGDLHSSRFFGGYTYIGTSKPTCRLCDYYFRAVGDGILVRQTHRNLYMNWRAPDVWLGQGLINGKDPSQRREDILNSMVVSIRKDTYRTLSDKVGERKRHDSNTSPTYRREVTSVDYSSRADEDSDDVLSTMGELGLDDD